MRASVCMLTVHLIVCYHHYYYYIHSPAVLKTKKRDFNRRQELKELFRLMYKWQRTVASRADCEAALAACRVADRKYAEDEVRCLPCVCRVCACVYTHACQPTHVKP